MIQSSLTWRIVVWNPFRPHRNRLQIVVFHQRLCHRLWRTRHTREMWCFSENDVTVHTDCGDLVGDEIEHVLKLLETVTDALYWRKEDETLIGMIYTMMDWRLDSDTAEIVDDARNVMSHLLDGLVHNIPEQYTSECHDRRWQWTPLWSSQTELSDIRILLRWDISVVWHRRTLQQDADSPMHDVRVVAGWEGRITDGMRSYWTLRVDEDSKRSWQSLSVFILCISALTLQGAVKKLYQRCHRRSRDIWKISWWHDLKNCSRYSDRVIPYDGTLYVKARSSGNSRTWRMG